MICEERNVHMELKDQFTGFYEAIIEDPRITPIHISMYMAILCAYLLHAGENPVQIDRDILMLHAKISGRSTYYKSLRELQEFGYIKYIPSFNYYLGSLVYLKRI
jgi:hypothetical protein